MAKVTIPQTNGYNFHLEVAKETILKAENKEAFINSVRNKYPKVKITDDAWNEYLGTIYDITVPKSETKTPKKV